MTKTSIVIPVYNGHHFLLSNLPNVLALGADEVICVDDCSTDDSAQIISTRFGQIKLIRHSHNTRFPISVNDGFKAATGDIIILLNQDVIPKPGLLNAVIPHFSSPRVFAVTFNEQGRSWSKAKLSQGLISYTNGPLSTSLHPSFWASGGSAAFRKSDWLSLGGFDSIFTPGYFEDADLGFRAHKRGLNIIWDPQALVSHTHPESTFNKHFSSTSLQFIKDRNYLLIHWKNLDSQNLFPHFKSVVTRIFNHPKYLIPVVMALTKIFTIINFRRQEKLYLKLSDAEVFAKFI